MSLASNLAKIGRLLLAQASGVIFGVTPAAADNSKALATTEWFKAEQSTEANQGTAKVATQAQANAGTDDATIVTPKKMRAGFSASFTGNGYIALPSWLGGFIIQWGTGNIGGTSAVFSFPLQFPNNCLVMVGNDMGAGTHALGLLPANAAQFTAYGSAANTAFQYLAIGR